MASKDKQAAGSQQRRARDDIYDEIENIIGGVLTKSDFDGYVRQTLHAIHGAGGRVAVHDALQVVRFYVSRKRQSGGGGGVQNWPAYVNTLLRNVMRGSRADPKRARERPGAMANGEDGTSVSGDKDFADEDALIEALRGRLAAGDSLKVPSSVRGGQLLDAELNSEFICRVCNDLCEDATLLPCTHVLCRKCVRGKPGAGGKLQCPVCSATFDDTPEIWSGGNDPWLKRWMGNIRICCAFAPRESLPDPEEDPLPPRHAARLLGLTCSWRGCSSDYAEHQRNECMVVKALRQLEPTPSTPGGGSPVRASSPESTCKQPLRSSSKQSVTEATVAAAAAAKLIVAAKTGGTQTAASGDEAAAWSACAANDTGDFIVTHGWRAGEYLRSGSDQGLSVTVGEKVYISKVHPSGWAFAKRGGFEGWLPRNFCERLILTVHADVRGYSDRGYLGLRCGDRVEVRHRDNDGWVYGKTSPPSGGQSETGWFPAAVLECGHP